MVLKKTDAKKMMGDAILQETNICDGNKHTAMRDGTGRNKGEKGNAKGFESDEEENERQRICNKNINNRDFWKREEQIKKKKEQWRFGYGRRKKPNP